MKCPLCKLELRIQKSYPEAENGREATVQEMGCVNRRCPNSVSRLPVRVVKTPADHTAGELFPADAPPVRTAGAVPAEDERGKKRGRVRPEKTSLRFCRCGAVLADVRQTLAGGYTVTEGAEYDVSTGGMMNVRCPDCGEWRAFQVW